VCARKLVLQVAGVRDVVVTVPNEAIAYTVVAAVRHRFPNIPLIVRRDHYDLSISSPEEQETLTHLRTSAH
jgi:hypothetical protein